MRKEAKDGPFFLKKQDGVFILLLNISKLMTYNLHVIQTEYFDIRNINTIR